MKRPKDLPEFDRPPVAEVILGIQFGTVPFRTYHAGPLAAVLKRYPTIEEHTPLSPEFEVFGAPSHVMGAPPVLQLISALPVPRYWFASTDGTELVQFQPDRQLHNWRREPANRDYPRYESLRKKFAAELKAVDLFLARQQIGRIVPNQCEITYNNHIELPGGADPRGSLSRIFCIWASDLADDRGRKIEDASIHYRYILQDRDGVPYGRLHAAMHPAIRTVDQMPIVQFSLTVRGRPASATIPAALGFIDAGRLAIVRAFASMTTTEMHSHWGKK